MSSAITMWMAFLAAFPMKFEDLSSEQQHQVDTVVATVYAEARGENNHGMLLVLGVILRRSADQGLSPYQVVCKPNQFAVPTSVVEMLDRMPIDTTELYRKAVMCLFIQQRVKGWKPTHLSHTKASRFAAYVELMNDGATHFFAVGKEPEYTKRMAFQYAYKGHSFWKEKEKSSLTRK